MSEQESTLRERKRHTARRVASPEGCGQTDGQTRVKTLPSRRTTYAGGNDNTLGPAYNEFGCNEYPAITNRFLCTILIDSNAKKFDYNEHPHPPTNEQILLHIFSRWKRDQV